MKTNGLSKTHSSKATSSCFELGNCQLCGAVIKGHATAVDLFKWDMAGRPRNWPTVRIESSCVCNVEPQSELSDSD